MTHCDGVGRGGDRGERRAVAGLSVATLASNAEVALLETAEAAQGGSDRESSRARDPATGGRPERVGSVAQRGGLLDPERGPLEIGLQETMHSTPEQAAVGAELLAEDQTVSSSREGLTPRAERHAGLLASAEETLDSAPPARGLAPEDELAPGSCIGRLEILRVLGVGGMGVVYEAYDPELDREVAVKLIRGGRDSSSARVRLLREAQALAKLAHPNVVAIYDVGVHDGQVWLSMEFVIGQTLSRWLKQERPRWRQVVDVLKQALRGLIAAHAEGLLHRDIKPDNIMVGRDGRVRVMDFGLARADTARAPHRETTDSPSALSIDLTVAGTILGTPAYMAPEQFLGITADERSDQFSIGVTAWEALHGRRAFTGATYSDLSIAVTTGKREPPSADAKVPAWLRRIIDRAMQVDRRQRFESLSVMLGAIEAGELRARVRLIIAGLVCGLLVLGALALVALVQWRSAAASEDRALRGEALAKKSEARARASEAATKELVETLELEKRAYKEALSVQRGLRAVMLIPEDREGEALKLGVQALGAYGPEWATVPPREATEGLERVLAEDAIVVERGRVHGGHTKAVWEVKRSPDGAHVATASLDRQAKVWDAQSGALLVSLEGHLGSVQTLAYAPDASQIVTGSFDGTARVWGLPSGETRAVLEGHGGGVFTVAYSPDGARIATGSFDATARIWDARTGEHLQTLRGHSGPIYSLAFSPDSALLATGGEGSRARVWDVASGDLLATLRGHRNHIRTLAFSPDGAHLATGGFDHTARIWETRTGRSVATLEGHEDQVRVLAYAPNGELLATASLDGTARVWDVRSGELVRTLSGHTRPIIGLDFSPESARIATGGVDQTVRVWDVASGALVTTYRGHRGSVYAVAYSADGAQLTSADQAGSVRTWSTGIDDESIITTRRGHRAELTSLAFSPGGERLVTASRDRSARIWDPVTGELVRVLEGHLAPVRSVDYAPDGAQIATASEDQTARLWDARTGEVTSILEGHGNGVADITYSPDGARVVTAGYDDDVRVWSATSGELVAVLKGHDDSVYSVVYAPDGAQLATSSRDESVRLWDAASGDLELVLSGHTDRIRALAYSPDGRRLVTRSADGTARIWDRASGEELATLETPGFGTILYSPDGRGLAIPAGHQAKLWDAVRGEVRLTLDGHEGDLTALAYSPDGRKVATAGDDGRVKVWSATDGELLASYEGSPDEITHLVYSPDGAQLVVVSTTPGVRILSAETGEVITELEDRVGLREADGSFTWPVPPRALTRVGCRRLERFADEHAEVAELCAQLSAGDDV